MAKAKPKAKAKAVEFEDTTPLDDIRRQLDDGADAGSLLRRAAGWGRLDVIELGFERGGAVTDDFGAVWAAAERNHRDVVEFLLANGASLDQARGGAARGANAELLEFLLKDGPPPSIHLLDMVAMRDPSDDPGQVRAIAAARCLLDHGLSANPGPGTGSAPLVPALDKGADELVAFLMSRGAKLTADDIQSGLDAPRTVEQFDRLVAVGLTPTAVLRLIIQKAHGDPEEDIRERVTMALKRGGQPSQSSDRINSPFVMAIAGALRDRDTYEPLVDLLLAHGASLEDTLADAVEPESDEYGGCEDFVGAKRGTTVATWLKAQRKNGRWLLAKLQGTSGPPETPETSDAWEESMGFDDVTRACLVNGVMVQGLTLGQAREAATLAAGLAKQLKRPIVAIPAGDLGSTGAVSEADDEVHMPVVVGELVTSSDADDGPSEVTELLGATATLPSAVVKAFPQLKGRKPALTLVACGPLASAILARGELVDGDDADHVGTDMRQESHESGVKGVALATTDTAAKVTKKPAGQIFLISRYD